MQQNQSLNESRAIARSIRIAPRKVQLVLDLIRGKNIKEAEAILMFTPNRGAEILSPILKSAAANAENNLGLKKDTLYVKECYVTEGFRIKRMLPRAQGRGDMIQKKTSHITIVVASKEDISEKKVDKADKKSTTKKQAKPTKTTKKTTQTKKVAAKKETKPLNKAKTVKKDAKSTKTKKTNKKQEKKVK